MEDCKVGGMGVWGRVEECKVGRMEGVWCWVGQEGFAGPGWENWGVG